MGELSSLGLPPEVLHRLITETAIPKVVYELNDGKSTRIEPQLRIRVNIPSSRGVTLVNSKLQGNVVGEDAAGSLYHHKLLGTLQPERTSSAGEEHTISEQRLVPVRYVN